MLSLCVLSLGVDVNYATCYSTSPVCRACHAYLHSSTFGFPPTFVARFLFSWAFVKDLLLPLTSSRRPLLGPDLTDTTLSAETSTHSDPFPQASQQCFYTSTFFLQLKHIVFIGKPKNLKKTLSLWTGEKSLTSNVRRHGDGPAKSWHCCSILPLFSSCTYRKPQMKHLLENQTQNWRKM